MITYFDTPIFGVAITLIAFSFSLFLSKRFKLSILNPVLVSTIIIIGFLVLFQIDYDTYNQGGSIITFFLGPATVILAVPLFNQINLLKKHLFPILIGIISGAIAGILSIVALSKFFKLDNNLILSLIPKSTTSAIAIDIANEIGGNESLTVVFVVMTGIIGYIIAEKVLKAFRINNSIAKGIAIGTSSHATGTARAIEMGEVEGAMSSLAIGVAGLITVFIAPIIVRIIGII